MSTPPLASVAITTRDRPALLVAAVRSVLEQTYPNVEVVVVDHGSNPPVTLPDALAADPRVGLHRASGELGLGAARNRSVALCAGEYVALLDDDDTFRPDKLARQVQHLEGAPDDVAGSECGYDLWEEDRHVGRFLPTDVDLSVALLENPRLQPSTVLLRRGVIEAVGGFDPDLDRVEDWDLWVRLADRYRVAALPEVLVDRAASRPDPTRALRRYEQLVARLEPRIAARPPAERRRLRAWHRFVIGVMHAQAGLPADARRHIWAAWRSSPGELRWLVHLARTLVGEDAWLLLARGRERMHVASGRVRRLPVP